jgi:hypothetical protein
VVHATIPALGRLREEDGEFNVILCYIVRPHKNGGCDTDSALL